MQSDHSSPHSIMLIICEPHHPSLDQTTPQTTLLPSIHNALILDAIPSSLDSTPSLLYLLHHYFFSTKLYHSLPKGHSSVSKSNHSLTWLCRCLSRQILSLIQEYRSVSRTYSSISRRHLSLTRRCLLLLDCVTQAGLATHRSWTLHSVHDRRVTQRQNCPLRESVPVGDTCKRHSRSREV